MNNIGQLLPVDGYSVRLQHSLPADFLPSLTHLYQPLIGQEALMLYLTLVNEVKIQAGDIQTHHTLMNYMMLPLDRIYEARIKLEAVGLLQTYKNETDNFTVYTYELQPPYDSRSFFIDDAMLPSLLLHYIGEQRFKRLKEHFVKDQPAELGEKVTAAFDDVFQTTPTHQLEQVTTKEQIQTAGEEPDLEVDFTWLEQMLKQRMIPVHRVLTKENRKLISQMLRLYGLESFEVDKALLFSINEENHLDRTEFEKACYDIYFSKNKKPIRLVPKKEPVKLPVEEDKPLSKEESLIRALETISPVQLLEDLSSGNFASQQDVKLITDVMATQGLPEPVMNVLIYYVLLQTNMKLSRAYVEKVAGQWSRAKLQTAREAMEFAKKERADYEQAKANRAGRRYNKAATNDIVPEWYKAGKHKEKPKDQETGNMSEEQRKVAELLKQYTEGN